MLNYKSLSNQIRRRFILIVLFVFFVKFNLNSSFCANLNSDEIFNQMQLHRLTMLLVYLGHGQVLVPFLAWQLLFYYPLGVLCHASVQNHFRELMIRQRIWVMDREHVSSFHSGRSKDLQRLSKNSFDLKSV